MCDGRFALSAEDLHVEVREATGDGQRHPQAAERVQGAELKVVVQGAHLVVVRDEPELSAGVTGGHV